MYEKFPGLFNPNVALNHGRYTWKHDSILNVLNGEMKSVASSDVEIFSDLAD